MMFRNTSGKLKMPEGNILGEPTDIPGIRKYVSFRDTEGNVCSLLQPVMPRDEKVEVEETGGTGEI